MMIADSDLLIDYLRGREPGTARIRREIATGRLATTVINAFELLGGAASKSDLSKVSRLLDALVILPLDLSATTLAAETRRRLEAKGRSIGMADYLIAGICLAHDATLLTRNLEHFGRVPDLRVSGPA